VQESAALSAGAQEVARPLVLAHSLRVVLRDLESHLKLRAARCVGLDDEVFADVLW
jgi:hypothetical protein